MLLLLINHLSLRFYCYSLSANIMILIIIIIILAKISTSFYLVAFLNKVHELEKIKLKILNNCQELKL